MNDWALIEEHLASGSEEAFAELARRHGPMVYSTALRRTGDAHLAEDITQAVFLVLARKAPSLSSGTVLAGWLYRTASLVSLRALRDNARRAVRERKAMESWNEDSETALWNRLEPELDPALAQLGSADRDALVLRYLQQLSHREVGEALGVSEETAKKRVQRALEKLRTLLERRVGPVTAAALAGVLAARATAAFPAELAKICGKGLVTSAAKELAMAALDTSYFAALKLLGTLGTLALIVWAATAKWPRDPSARPAVVNVQSAPTPLVAEESQIESAAADSSPAATASRTFRLRVVEAESGVPLAHAEVVKLRYGSKFGRQETRADEAGEVELEIPEPFESGIGIIAAAPGRAPNFVHWGEHEGESLPKVYSVRLEAGMRLTGQVVNEDGAPVAGAKLHFNGRGMEAKSREYVTYNSKTSTPETDKQGLWEADFLAPNTQWLGGRISHPDYAENNFSTNFTEFRPASLLFTVQRGGTVAGQVLGADGTPISNAEMEFADLTGWRNQRSTNADPNGQFAFEKVAKGEFRLRASAPEYQARDVIVNFGGIGETNMQIALEPQPRFGNALLLGRVLHADGRPARGAQVWLFPAKPDAPSWKADVDSKGRFVWHHAPDGPLKLFAGYGEERSPFHVQADGTEHELRLPEAPTMRLSGTVRDGATGVPVPLAKMMLKPSASAGPHRTEEWLGEAYEGVFSFRVQSKKIYSAHPNVHYSPQLMARMGLKEHGVVLVEAKGYRPKTVDLPAQTNDIEIAIELEAGGAISGLVRLPNGEPAFGAQVAFGTKSVRAYMQEPGKFADFGNPGQKIVTAGRDGQFEIEPDFGAERLLVAHEHGWANIPLPRGNNVEVLLQPWARVEGRVMLGGKPTPGANLKAGPGTEDVALLNFGFQAAADSNGRFVFEKVPGGEILIMILNSGDNIGVFSHPVRFEARAGENASVVIGGGKGVRLSGRIKVEDPSRVDWRRSPLHLSLKSANAVYFSVAPQSYALFCQPDGTFVLEDVLPGEYRLYVRLEGFAETVDRIGNKNRENLGSLMRELAVFNKDFDLGVLEVLTPRAQSQALIPVPMLME